MCLFNAIIFLFTERLLALKIKQKRIFELYSDWSGSSAEILPVYINVPQYRQKYHERFLDKKPEKISQDKKQYILIPINIFCLVSNHLSLTLTFSFTFLEWSKYLIEQADAVFYFLFLLYGILTNIFLYFTKNFLNYKLH